MNLDTDKIDEDVLALLYLTSFRENIHPFWRWPTFRLDGRHGGKNEAHRGIVQKMPNQTLDPTDMAVRICAHAQRQP